MSKANPLATNSPAKQKCIDFIRTPDNTEMQFTLEGADEDAAKRFVHHMRVELSRMRRLLRNEGRRPRMFKLKVRSIVPTNEGDCIITLFKDAAGERLETSIEALFPDLAREA